MLDLNAAVLAVFLLPAVIVAMVIGFAAYQRYLKHKEWMAMINQGIIPPEVERGSAIERPTRAGASTAIIVTLVGVAITLGLSTLGMGPWLIGGLVPTAIGCALLIGQFFGESKEKKRDE